MKPAALSGIKKIRTVTMVVIGCVYSAIMGASVAESRRGDDTASVESFDSEKGATRGARAITSPESSGRELRLMRGKKPKAHPAFHAIRFVDSARRSHRLSQWVKEHGRPVIVIAWGTFCPPCRKEMPSVQQMAKDLRGQVDVLPLCLDGVGKFAQENNLTLPLYDSPSLGLIMDKMRLSGIPCALFFAADGRLVHFEVGARQWNDAESLDLIRRKFGLKGPRQKKGDASTASKDTGDSADSSSDKRVSNTAIEMGLGGMRRQPLMSVGEKAPLGSPVGVDVLGGGIDLSL